MMKIVRHHGGEGRSASPSSKGQSTVEYILLVTAVIAVIILFTTGKNNLFQQRLNSVLNTTTQDMLNVASHLQDNAAG
jgi:hypothetical protein